MGVIDKALKEAAGVKDEFVDGYRPERCWYRSGYVTSEMIDCVRESISGADDMSDEDIIFIITQVGLYEGTIPADSDEVSEKIAEYVMPLFGKFIEHRGERHSFEDEHMLMLMLGWNDWCLMQGNIAIGGVPTLKLKKCGPTHGYYKYYVEVQ